MLNGRKYLKNDFTSVSCKGLAVVDYCIVGHNCLSLFDKFNVVRATDLVNSASAGRGFTPSSIPDHSVLTWTFEQAGIAPKPEFGTCITDAQRVKYDPGNIPDNFLSDMSTVESLNLVVSALEGSLRNQMDIDSAYSDLCNIIKSEMQSKLGSKRIIIASGTSNKRRRIGKPWWSESLSLQWNKVCRAEKDWLKCSAKPLKASLKSVYVSTRKEFDRQVQRAKRTHWFILQSDLLREAENNDTEFWKTIGRVGIAQSKDRCVPMEIVLEDGSIDTKLDNILHKWKTDFFALYNRASSNVHEHSDLYDMEVDADQDNHTLNNYISIFEVKTAVFKAKKNKASGFDEIPSDILCSDSAISFLHMLFNVCFNSSLIPSDWGKGIINPIPKSSTADRRDPLSYRGITLANSMYKLYCSLLNDRLSK